VHSDADTVAVNSSRTCLKLVVPYIEAVAPFNFRESSASVY
jgi:hypothetical protein